MSASGCGSSRTNSSLSCFDPLMCGVYARHFALQDRPAGRTALRGSGNVQLALKSSAKWR